MPVRALKGSLHNKSMEPHSLRRSAMTCSDNSASKHKCLCLPAGLAQWQSCSSQLCSSITAPHSPRPISPTSAVAFAPLLARLTGTPIGHVLGRAKEVHEREQYSKQGFRGVKTAIRDLGSENCHRPN